MANLNNFNNSKKINEHPIAIKTSWGKYFGMGHLQRMTSVLWFLNEIKNKKTFLITDSIPEAFPEELNKYVKKNIDFLPSLIIRDMRDSSKDEIESLRETCKVVSIDDNGIGRTIADYAIDILPNPEKAIKRPGLKHKNIFLYGYNFINALFKIKDKTIKKYLDFAIYPGNSADSGRIDILTSSLPLNSNFAILNGKDSYTVINGVRKPLKESSYALTILSSKVLISHFGITLYEGFISGCRLFTINPTPYHSLLANMAENNLGLTNLGIYDKINKEETAYILKKSVITPLYRTISGEDVYKTTMDNLEEFYNLLITIL